MRHRQADSSGRSAACRHHRRDRGRRSHGFAVEFASRDVRRPELQLGRKTRDRRDRLGDEHTNAPLFADARSAGSEGRKHQTAPLKAIEAIEAATRLPYEDGCRRERDLFLECVRSEQARALVHIFFAERAATKPPADASRAAPLPVNTVAIVGAGTMGGGIAMACANAGVDVVLTDSGDQALDAGIATIRKNYDVSVSRGRLTADDVGQRMARIHPVPTTEFASRAGSADLIVEAVFEDLGLKQQVFRELDRIAKPGCVLATNTSTLDIDAIASATSRPASVVGLHFFSPAAVMRLLEVVRGPRTGVDVLATALAFAKRLKKLGVTVGNGPGFVGNRLLFPYMYEAQFLVEEGATPEQVDKALTDFGMAMGIFAVDDMAGLDVGWRAFAGARALQRQKRAAPARARPARRDGSARPEARQGLVSLRRSADADAGSRSARADPVGGGGRRTSAARDHRERDCAAHRAGAGQRGRARAFCRRRRTGVGHRRDLRQRLRLPILARRPDVLRRPARAGECPRAGDEAPSYHGERWRPAPLLSQLAADGRTFRELDRSRLD